MNPEASAQEHQVGPEPERDSDKLLEIVREAYTSVQFNQFLGLELSYLTTNGAGFYFPMKESLMANRIHGNLHGGVISAVLDAAGSIAASASAVERMRGLSPQQIASRIARMGTIDMRVDYLRPGIGTRFLATSTVIRTGRKVAVTRMELRNQDQVLVAVGGAAHMVG